MYKKDKSTVEFETSNTKPETSDFWDDMDPRGPSSSEISAYEKALKNWQKGKPWKK